MRYLNLLPKWAQPVFQEAGLELQFKESKMDCAKCSFASGDYRDGNSVRESYLANLKCCTFFPNLPNFTAGFELQKNALVFDELLRDSTISLPLGINAPETYKEKYSVSPFGIDKEMLCPHFDRLALNCSIWESRPSSCVRFVCKSSYANDGQKIWEYTESALNTLEMNLAYEAALQAGLVNFEINSRTWSVSIEEKKKFYLRAADYVKSLSAAEKIEIAGEQFTEAKSKIKAAASFLAQTATV